MLSFPSSKSCPIAKPVPQHLRSSLLDSFCGSKSLSFNPQTGFNLRPKSLQIKAMEASLDYHFGTQLQTHIKTPTSLKIAIIGFGNVGQFHAKTFVSQGHTVLAHSRSDNSDTAAKLGVSFFSDPHDLCEEHPEVVMLCTSILSTKSELESIPFQRLRRSTLFVDVFSVKEFPRSLFVKVATTLQASGVQSSLADKSDN
ncbi:arogenate dehydrogenase 2, chloroplastic-like [Vitis riparia]|uniref:arogenate dehydrogenase 2, chloroplastic-like n=1 Tax=Vitis riparia TaxID=96939 RepID=UPI00155A32AB|nr:arogenate dehydrogenase 2, chloroplastic-like [Vitis riparia]